MRASTAVLGGLLVLVAPACTGPARVTPSVALPERTAPAAPAPAASSVVAAPPASSGPDDDEVITPCQPGTPEHDAAREALRVLDARIEALPDAADPAPVKQALASLLGTRCFLLAGDEGEIDAVDSALSLKTFWASGGKWWLGYTLDLGQDGPRHAAVPPTARKTLARSNGPGHPLAPLVCAPGDPGCGQETQGWAARAEQALASWAEVKRARDASHETAPSHVPTPAGCAAKALATAGPDAKREAYDAWRGCIHEVPLTVSALRLGRLRAPREGWLVVRGRRGHYQFCDEVRAYDLATGAAYVAQSCSGLALRSNGGVDHRATDAARARKVEAGRLSAENLREAVWMALLADEVDHDVRLSGEVFEVPRGLTVRGGRIGFGMGGGSFSGSSAQTRLAWSYVAGGKVVKSGSLTYPYDLNDAAHEHALQLLLIAEASFEPGCPPAPILARIEPGTTQPGVSHLDATAEGLRATEAELTAALDAFRGRPACASLRGGRRPPSR